MQLRVHFVEGGDVALFPLGSFLAGEAHAEEGEAVAGQGVFLTGLALFVEIMRRSKIGLAKFRRAIEVGDGAQHMAVQFAEVLGDLAGSDGDVAVVDGEGDCSHGDAPTLRSMISAPAVKRVGGTVRVDRPERRHRQGLRPPARPAHRACHANDGRKKTAEGRLSAYVFRAVKPDCPK